MPLQPFNAKTVALRESNLIEASAGTGKTYSIALLVLRLVIEHRMPIQQILMVTFTRAAVAELEIRVRAFVRMGLKAARGENIDDETIRDLVAEAIAKEPGKGVEERLYEAQLLLDEVSVLTIHSFCQKILNEFAFETAQIFDAETLSPDAFNQLLEDRFNEYWRQRITTIDIQLLTILLQSGLTYKDVLNMVKQGVGGKKPWINGGVPPDFLSAQHQQECIRIFTEGVERQELIKEELFVMFAQQQQAMLSNLGTNQNAIKNYRAALADQNWELLTERIRDKRTVNYTAKCIPDDILQKFDELETVRKEGNTTILRIIAQIGMDAFARVGGEVLQAKAEAGTITFDDMIVKLRTALEQGEQRQTLIAAVRKKFTAVFIDEFQDTDRDQYIIFHTLFGEQGSGSTKNEGILFYIGDPKQSIYGWRKADIATYFKAAGEVKHTYTMDVNYRSSQPCIEAMNRFFLPEPGFDTFAYNNQPNPILYQPVRSPSPNTKGKLLHNGQEPYPIRLSRYANKKVLYGEILHLVWGLLYSGEYQIEKDGECREVVPEDIGILVRRNSEARAIRKILSRVGIACVTIDDSKIFKSTEAKDIYHVLAAVREINRANINRALVTRIGGYTKESLLRADMEAIMRRFKTYQESWNKDGVYVMLRQFLSDHDLHGLFYRSDVPNAERIVANVLQIVELLHKTAERKRYDPLELLQWLKKGMDGEVREGDDAEQRIESDEKTVKIETIHKSKGLEYNIVIAPHLDFTIKKKDNPLSYRHPSTGDYLVTNRELMTPDEVAWAEQQMEQENRRLLYVAVTRARYQCFLFRGDKAGESTLWAFTDQLEKRKVTPGVELWAIPAQLIRPRPAAAGGVTRVYATADRFRLTDAHWRKSSYSSLSPEGEVVPLPRYTGVSTADYDRFVFRDLRRGALTGNLLHYIFEHMSFTDDAHWAELIDRAIRRMSTPKPESSREGLKQMLREVTSTEILPGLTLQQIAQADRLNELEFDFPVDGIRLADLERLSTPEIPLRVSSTQELEGMMTGKIDMLFRHEGKYYILDWKSNYLGEQLRDYQGDGLREAMAHHNYHLQYHIYILAVIRYLQLRIPGFDYEQHFGGVFYLFVRGTRAGSDGGVFYHRPALQKLEALAFVHPSL